MTVFLRLLAEEDKRTALRSSCARIRQDTEHGLCFVVNPEDFAAICRIPDDHMVACETDAGVSDTTLSSPASAYCS